jgi:hypothetical protein
MKPEDGRLSTADLANASERERVAQAPHAVMDRPDTVAAPAERAAERNVPKAASVMPAGEDARAPLFAEAESADYRKRWSDIQIGFVDEPRQAVERADSLVAEAMKRLAEGFAKERTNLEHQWDRGDKVTTEDLRIVLRRYRSFFDRLLSI